MSMLGSFSRARLTFLFAGIAVLAASCGSPPTEVQVVDDPVQRGAYLVSVMGCGDCHTPGYFLGDPDETRALAGSDVGFLIPDLGYFYGSNLAPDMDTGLGSWTETNIVTALRTGVRPDGRILAPSMPWQGFASLTDEDAGAIAAYLKILSPISNQVPPLTGAGQTPPAPYLAVMFSPGPEPEPEP